ncbi:MAG: sugar ABC transporter substrate-binding protein [Oscillospiraceae bacterium]|nr:sugar ABC transporter substrate-binding protein [Oscillospiraceae bacterium]
MKKKILVILACVLVMSMLLAACDNGSGGGATPSAPAGPEGADVTMILKNFVNPFWLSVRDGANAAAEYYGINLTVLAPLVNESNEEQSMMADQAIINQVDLLIMCPTDTYGIVPAVRRVYDAGIPIVALNTRIGGDILWHTFVVAENFDAGYGTAARLADMMGEEGEIILLEGVPGAQTAIDRLDGAREALTSFPNINIVAQQSADFNRAIAMDVTQNLLQAHPNVTALWAANDEMALGALEAIDAAGLTGQIMVAGIDATGDGRQALRDGRLAITCSTDPFMQGYYAVQAAAAVLRGESLPDVYTVPIRVLGSVAELDELEAS